ncbi:MAG: carbamate kinase [Candidatus Diapherotrites archaeon]
MKKEVLVIALGGNALIKNGQKGTVYEQFANTREALTGVVELVRQGHKIVLTHGNGPQVGNIVIRTEAAIGKAYEVPLGVAVAESQGEIGYMIQQTLQNKLRAAGIKREVVTVITQVIVDKNDPQIKNPTKPIGPFYSREEIERLRERKITIIEDSGRGYRRVVPSPIPLDVVEKEAIKKLIENDVIVIAAGGGGMPVYIDENGNYEGIDGVVDKDLATAVLAEKIGAKEMIILTGVEKVFLNYNKPNQKELDKLTVGEAKLYLSQGQFPEGSMGPKIQAAIQFIERGGEKVIITSIDKLLKAIKGKTGTTISA